MQHGMFIQNVAPNLQGLLAQRFSPEDGSPARYTGPKGPATNDEGLAGDHPGLTIVGLVGFDASQGRFVLLKMGDDGKRKDSDAPLSDREREVMQLVAAGYTNAQIARELIISRNTVKVHLRNIFEKLGVQSRTQAAMYAIRQGCVRLPGSVT